MTSKEAKYDLLPDPAGGSSLALFPEPGSFLSPRLDDSRRCSTRMKTKEAAADIQQPKQEAKHALLHDPDVRPSLAVSPSPRISNKVSARPKSFLQVNKKNILPPSPDDIQQVGQDGLTRQDSNALRSGHGQAMVTGGGQAAKGSKR